MPNRFSDSAYKPMVIKEAFKRAQSLKRVTLKKKNTRRKPTNQSCAIVVTTYKTHAEHNNCQIVKKNNRAII